MNPLAVVLLVAACGACAYAATNAIVLVANLLGLCYSAKREERAHANDARAFSPVARRKYE